MDKLLEFIQNQRLIVIATHNDQEIWTANIYFGADERAKIYFISPENNKHSQMIIKNPQVAFSITWFDANDHKNRKAVQGLGICRAADNEEEIVFGVKLHNKNFPEFSEKITVDYIHHNEWGSKVWVLEPSYIKYWDDEIYGDEESEEFNIA